MSIYIPTRICKTKLGLVTSLCKQIASVYNLRGTTVYNSQNFIISIQFTPLYAIAKITKGLLLKCDRFFILFPCHVQAFTCECYGLSLKVGIVQVHRNIRRWLLLTIIVMYVVSFISSDIYVDLSIVKNNDITPEYCINLFREHGVL